MSEGRLASLYSQYGPAIYGRCRRLLADPAAAEDATHEVFVRVARHLEQAPTSIEALMWIFRIATNYCLNERRRQRRWQRWREAPPIEPMPEIGEQVLADRDLARRVIEWVPEHLRVPAWLYYVDGMSHDEVGRMLGLSRRTIINYLGEFRKRATTFVAQQ